MSAEFSSEPSRAARLDTVLRTLLATGTELEAAAVVSFDGLAMASVLPLGMDEDRVAAMSAALLSLGEKAAAGLGRGDLSQVYVEGEHGTVFLISADDEAVLVVVASKAAKAGLVLYEARRAAHEVGALLAAPAAPELSIVAPPDFDVPVQEMPRVQVTVEDDVSASSAVFIANDVPAEWGATSSPQAGVWSPYQSTSDWS